MVAPTCFGITLPSSRSVPSAFWEMVNWGAVDRILWMGVLCLVTWCVHHVTRLSTRFWNICYRSKNLTCYLNDSKCYAYVINFNYTFNITFPRVRLSDPSSPKSNYYSCISLFLVITSTNKKHSSYPSFFRYTRTQSLLTGCSQNM
jgi:hypothetical protein